MIYNIYPGITSNLLENYESVKSFSNYKYFLIKLDLPQPLNINANCTDHNFLSKLYQNISSVLNVFRKQVCF